MFSFCCAFFAVSLLNSLHDFHVSSCDEYNTKTVFTPSRLVVKYGDATSATCLVSQHASPNDTFSLEKSVGVTTKNGTTILWKVDSLTEWDINPTCYYTYSHGKQSCTILNVTIYQPPKNVRLSLLNHTGPMLAGHLYTLQCKVQEVAPVGNLTVIFYRGQTELHKLQSNSTEMTPVTEFFTLNINASKEDNGVQYWCEARLDLGTEGPQPPPVVMSGKLTTNVHYKPSLNGSKHTQTMTVTKGDQLKLNCIAVGNPSPSYNWKLPSATDSPFHESTLTIKSVTWEHEGEYICSVHNNIGTVTMTFIVDVEENFRDIILVVVLSIIFCLALGFVCVYFLLYKQSRKGQYNVFRLRTQHVALPI